MPSPSPEAGEEPEEDLASDLFEDESPRIEIISEAEEEEAFASTVVDDGDQAYTPEPFGADWDLGGSGENGEPVAEEPAGEPEPEPEAEAEADKADTLPRVSSPALRELADDVAASAKERDAGAERSDEPGGEPERRKGDDELTVRTVETVSPMDLVMSSGNDDEDEDAEAPHHRAGSPGGAA